MTTEPFDIDNLSPWEFGENSSIEAQGKGPLESLFVKSLSVGEMQALLFNLAPQANQANVEWKRNLLVIHRALDNKGKHLYVFNAPDQSISVVVDILGPPLAAPAGISSGGEDGSPGPIIPCRVLRGKRGSPNTRKMAEGIMEVASESGLDFCNTTARTVEEVLTGFKYFEDASSKLSDTCKERFRKSAKSKNGLFELSFLTFLQSPSFEKAEHPPCSFPGCDKPGVKRCAICRTAYCSTECQKADWKPTHKAVCAARSRGLAPGQEGGEDPAASRKSVIVDPLSDNALPQGHVAVSMQLGGQSRISKVGKDRVAYKEGEFIVKIQGGMFGGSPLLIYDKERSFQFHVDHLKSPGKDIASFMNSFKTVPGSPYPGSVKVFLYARTEEKGVRVFIDKLAPWQAW